MGAGWEFSFLPLQHQGLVCCQRQGTGSDGPPASWGSWKGEDHSRALGLGWGPPYPLVGLQCPLGKDWAGS